MGYGMAGYGWLMMGLVWVLPLALVAVGVLVLLLAGTSNRPESPAEILTRRYARGELDTEEYRRARAELASPVRP